MPGGFIGVDIFFVISGFVISGVIHQDYSQSRFSLIRFYEKRIRRIYPALLLVMLVVSVFGWQSLFADELKQLGLHIVASAFFVANLVLYSETGYFDNAAETKPLLHLWSLAVEEQFYIIWPILLVYILKRFRSKISLLIRCFIALWYMVQVIYYQYDSEAAFYLPFNRAWELAVGALGYFRVVNSKPLSISPWLQTLLALVVLIAALGLIDKDNFPGWIVCLPVISAWGIITAPSNQLKCWIFENRLLVFIGTISYPLYLWHWPIIAYLHILKGENISHGLIMGGVLVAFVLAYLTYWLLEKPIRFGVWKTKNVALPLLLMMLFMAGVGYSAIFHQGYKDRTVAIGSMGFVFVNTKDMGYLTCQDDTLMKVESKIDYCYIGKPGIADSVILGDSHAEDKFWGLVEKDVQHNWMLMGSTQCPFLADELSDNLCQQKSRHMIQWLQEQPQLKNVVLAFFMNKWLEIDYPKTLDAWRGDLPLRHINMTKMTQMAAGLTRTIDVLLKQGKQVTILIDMPQLPYNPKSCSRMQVNCQLSVERMVQDQQSIRQLLSNLKQSYPALNIFDPKSLVCDEQFCSYQRDGVKIYRDQDHLTPQGSKLYAAEFIKTLSR